MIEFGQAPIQVNVVGNLPFLEGVNDEMTMDWIRVASYMWSFFSLNKNAAEIIGSWDDLRLFHKLRVLCKAMSKLKKRSELVAQYNLTVLDYDLHIKLEPWFDYMFEVLQVCKASKYKLEVENGTVEAYSIDANGAKSMYQANDDNMSTDIQKGGVERYLLDHFYYFDPSPHFLLNAQNVDQIKHTFGNNIFKPLWAARPQYLKVRGSFEETNIQPRASGQQLTATWRGLQYDRRFFDDHSEVVLQKALNLAALVRFCILTEEKESFWHRVNQHLSSNPPRISELALLIDSKYQRKVQDREKLPLEPFVGVLEDLRNLTLPNSNAPSDASTRV